jgi:ubiquinone/menaquinone biosynthesis C-methylase UbiE
MAPEKHPVTDLGELFFEIHRDLPREGPGQDRYTRQAFEMLPPMEAPRILDIGCGPGAPTVELALLSGGEVIGIDIFQQYLDQLQARIDAAGVADRVRAVNCSMFEIDFPDSSFDVVWAEGSIFIIGFDRGLREWRRLIRPGGFLAVHDVVWLEEDPPEEIAEFFLQGYPNMTTVEGRVDQVSACGYRSLGSFPLGEDAWWDEYYDPLEARIEMLRAKYADNAEALAELAEHQLEIDLYRMYNRWYGSVFFVMQRPARTSDR